MMNQIAKEWLEFAKSDLKNADILFRNKSYRDCIWYCHQSLEKLLKAVLLRPPDTVEEQPQAVLIYPPATLEAEPQAVLLYPPAILE